MKNAFDQKKFDAIVKKAFEAAPDQSRESLTNIAQDLMKSINQEHDKYLSISEQIEKDNEIKQYQEHIKSLEKQLNNAQNKLKQQERASALYNTLDGMRNTLSTHIQSAITICTTAKDKLISTIEKTGKEFRDNAEKARRTKELNKEKTKELKAIDDKLITAKATKNFYEQEYEFYSNLDKNCEQSLEKLNKQKEELIKVYEQTNERVSLIKNGFKNLFRSFKGQDAQTLAETGDRTKLFEGVTSKALEKINADIERITNDKAEYQLQETELKNEIRACMENLGYYNCGITMTKVMDENGKREYRVLLHHMDLDKADSERVNELYLMLSYIQMPEENMTVNYTIF